VSSVAVTGEDSAVLLISHKRAVSAELSHSTKRALASSIYKGTSLHELHDFLLSYKVYFNMIKKQLTCR
jgi:ubiquinone biosynthesis protein COQ9